MSSAQEMTTSRVCPQCGRILEESLFSCPYCGRDLTGRKKKLEIALKAPAHSRARLTFVVLGGFYFFVLLASYLLALFNQIPTLYGWFLIPATANFFVGYLVREVDTATKIIVVSFLIHTCIIIGLMNLPLVYGAWLAIAYSEAVVIIFIFLYYILNIPLGVTVSLVGITTRNNIRLLERSKKVKFLFVASMLLSMGIASTLISSDFYRVEGEPTLWVGSTVKISFCGFPLPYLHFTNSSTVTIFNIGESLGIQPFNYTNFLLDALFYVSIYSTTTALGYTITRSKKTRKKLDEYLAIG